MSDSRVTWLLPTLNAERFLTETLGSIARQTHGDHEVLGWDNGSVDQTVEILRQWIPSRIPGRIVTDSPFASLGDCLAAMVETASTELLARIDADDLAHPGRLAAQVAELRGNTALLGCGCQEHRIDEQGHPLRSVRRYTLPTDVRFALLFTNPLPHPGMMLRRSAVLAAGNYSDLPMGQDLDLWHRLTELGPVSQVGRPLLTYRVHSGSIGSARRQDWTALQLALLAKYRERLFPGADAGTVQLASGWTRGLDHRSGTPRDAIEALIELASSAGRAPAWRGQDFMRGAVVLDAARRAVPGPHRQALLKLLIGLTRIAPAARRLLPGRTESLGGTGS
jgi:hypothetical protein